MLQYFLIFFLFISASISNAEIKDKIVQNLKDTENLDFKFEQNINGKIENGNCTIEYPKKIFCEYERRKNKVLVSNGKSLVIKNNKQYYRYPIKKTPFEFLLDKKFLINKIKSSELSEVKDKFLFLQIIENNNNINVFFSQKNYELVGWQVEDIYQNLAVTYIFNTSINNIIDEKLFKLPSQD